MYADSTAGASEQQTPQARPAGIMGDGPATIAAWVLPGIAEVASLDEWLKVVASAEGFAQPLAPGPVRDWLRDSLSAAAARSQLSQDLIRDLAAVFDANPSPVEFARSWLRCRALLPLVQWGGKNPLRTAGLDLGSVQQRAMARRLPLAFPLPEDMHKEVCDQMRRALQTARVQRPDAFEDAVLHLNALWDGVAEELAVWLEIEPRGMTAQAAERSYRVLVEDSTRVFLRLAQLAARWVTDFRCLHQASHLVLLTADHGFTYGPPSGKESTPTCGAIGERAGENPWE